MASHQRFHSSQAILIPFGIENFGQAVRIEEQRIAGRQLQVADGKLRGAEHAQWHSGRLARAYSSLGDMQQRQMSRAGVLDFSVVPCAAYDKGGLFSRRRALTKQPVGIRHQVF